VMVCLFYVSPERLNVRTYFRTWPLWIVTGCYVYWRMHAKGFDGPQTYGRFYEQATFSSLRMYAEHPAYRIYTFFASLPAYLKLLVWPTGLHMERSFSIFTKPFYVPVISGVVIFGLAVAQIIYSCRHQMRGRELTWGLLWFGAAHAPDSGILIAMNSLFLEHWMYLPSVGLFLGLGEMLAKALEAQPKILSQSCCALGFLIALGLSAKTYNQNYVWRDPETFYTNIFAYHEASARSHNNLALYYSARGQYADAVIQFKEAIKISDTYAETEYNLALTYINMPNRNAHLDDIVDCLKRSIQIEPTFYRSYVLLANLYDTILKDPEQAAFYHKKADELISQRQ